MSSGVSVIYLLTFFQGHVLKHFGIEESGIANSPQDQHFVLFNQDDVMNTPSAKQEM